jgi:alkylation response protein AidB-like acyl-CoA dehydrogenase
VLNGEKVAVSNGANADTLIVAARTAGEQSDDHGISLFLVPADAAGRGAVSYRLMDGQKVANITFHGRARRRRCAARRLPAAPRSWSGCIMEAHRRPAAPRRSGSWDS